MLFKELKLLDKKALQQKLVRYKKECFNLRFQKKFAESINTSRLKEARRIISRINTLFTNIN